MAPNLPDDGFEQTPHVKFPVRVDGIEASGLDDNGELVVDRQPRF